MKSHNPHPVQTLALKIEDGIRDLRGCRRVDALFDDLKSFGLLSLRFKKVKKSEQLSRRDRRLLSAVAARQWEMAADRTRLIEQQGRLLSAGCAPESTVFVPEPVAASASALAPRVSVSPRTRAR